MHRHQEQGPYTSQYWVVIDIWGRLFIVDRFISCIQHFITLKYELSLLSVFFPSTFHTSSSTVTKDYGLVALKMGGRPPNPKSLLRVNIKNSSHKLNTRFVIGWSALCTLLRHVGVLVTVYLLPAFFVNVTFCRGCWCRRCCGFGPSYIKGVLRQSISLTVQKMLTVDCNGRQNHHRLRRCAKNILPKVTNVVAAFCIDF